ncbi:MAG: hypothetical protein ABI175_09645 [Polyangiales bacterium]
MNQNKMRFLRATTVSSFVSLAGLLAVACGPQDSTGVGNPGLTQDEQALVTDGNDSNSAGDTASSIISIPMLGIGKKDDIVTADLAAGFGVAGVKGPVFGACTTTTRDANVVTYEFLDCIGPFGFLNLTGKLVATYTVTSPGSVDIDVTSTALTINKTPIVETGHATVSFLSDGSKQIVWNGQFDGTTPRGRPVKHGAAYTIGITTDPKDTTTCVALDGSATTTVDLGVPKLEHGVTTTISGYLRCGARTVCPKSGTVDVVNLTPGAKVHDVHVQFLGGPQAQVTVTRADGKKTFTVPLSCD